MVKGELDFDHAANPVTKGELEENEGWVGEGVGDPTCRHGNGDVYLGSHAGESRAKHLHRNREHRKKYPDRKASGNGVSARGPEFPRVEGFGKSL